MGNPLEYYKRMLQAFCFALNVSENSELAMKCLEENSIKSLEQEINIHRKIKNEKNFMSKAVKVCCDIMSEVEEEGCDAWNACVGGLSAYLKFIGLEEETDDSNDVTECPVCKKKIKFQYDI